MQANQEYYVKLLEIIAEEKGQPGRSLNSLVTNPDYLRQLSDALLDGVTFEIIDKLRELQLMTESNLFRKREELVSDIKNRRKQYHQDVASTSLASSTLIQKFEKQLSKEMIEFDRQIVAELDGRLSEQQSTLQRAGLPGFVQSNNPNDIAFQMDVMKIVTRLEERIGRIEPQATGEKEAQ